MSPLIFKSIEEYFIIRGVFLIAEANNANKIITTHWPNANKKNNPNEKIIFFL